MIRFWEGFGCLISSINSFFGSFEYAQNFWGTLIGSIFLWGGKTHCTLIATSNVDNVNRRQKRQKLNYKLRVILMQKGIVVFIFANYLENVLVWNYTMSGFKRGIEKAGTGSIPACICV